MAAANLEVSSETIYFSPNMLALVLIHQNGTLGSVLFRTRALQGEETKQSNEGYISHHQISEQFE